MNQALQFKLASLLRIKPVTTIFMVYSSLKLFEICINKKNFRNLPLGENVTGVYNTAGQIFSWSP